MANLPGKNDNPVAALENLRQKIQDGRQLLVEELTDADLSAMQELILAGKAEIISLACRPYLSAKLDRIIVSH